MRHAAAITRFVVDEFLPDVSPGDLAVDYDLLANGVVDSLGLLKLIAWVEDQFDLAVDDDALDPANFRTVAAVDEFVERSTAGAVAGR